MGFTTILQENDPRDMLLLQLINKLESERDKNKHEKNYGNDYIIIPKDLTSKEAAELRNKITVLSNDSNRILNYAHQGKSEIRIGFEHFSTPKITNLGSITNWITKRAQDDAIDGVKYCGGTIYDFATRNSEFISKLLLLERAFSAYFVDNNIELMSDIIKFGHDSDLSLSSNPLYFSSDIDKLDKSGLADYVLLNCALSEGTESLNKYIETKKLINSSFCVDFYDPKKGFVIIDADGYDINAILSSCVMYDFHNVIIHTKVDYDKEKISTEKESVFFYSKDKKNIEKINGDKEKEEFKINSSLKNCMSDNLIKIDIEQLFKVFALLDIQNVDSWQHVISGNVNKKDFSKSALFKIFFNSCPEHKPGNSVELTPAHIDKMVEKVFLSIVSNSDKLKELAEQIINKYKKEGKPIKKSVIFNELDKYFTLIHFADKMTKEEVKSPYHSIAHLSLGTRFENDLQDVLEKCKDDSLLCQNLFDDYPDKGEALYQALLSYINLLEPIKVIDDIGKKRITPFTLDFAAKHEKQKTMDNVIEEASKEDKESGDKSASDTVSKETDEVLE